MRRILVFVVVAALALAMAVPAFAASDNASCVGQTASGANKNFGPGKGGAAISQEARNDRVSGLAQADREDCPSVIIFPL